jgi:deoxyribodipyrimidine photo-lyase
VYTGLLHATETPRNEYIGHRNQNCGTKRGTVVTVAIWWIRRDLRLDDNPALQAALAAGAAIPLYIHAPDEEAPWAPGAASRAWLRRSLEALARELRQRGSDLLLIRGPTLPTLLRLAQQHGAVAVHWNRCYEPAVLARDTEVKRALREHGLGAHSHGAALWSEPWEIASAAGTPYRVFTPFWRTLRARLPQPVQARPAPARLPLPPLPGGVPLDELLPAPRPAWDAGFWTAWQPGEAGAGEALDAFLGDAVTDYPSLRDRPDHAGTSRLSPHLHFGEISPRRILARLQQTRWQAKATAGVEAFLRELGWREFAHHLLYHFPSTPEANLDRRFDRFAWSRPQPDALAAWQSGRTGIPLVDAGMRELWQTGWMHNRVRMVVASFLCKNLRLHWLEGARWFWDTLVDADLANNTLGWQWTAGTGADAAPYFRIFNPVSQARRFDPQARYVRRWLPELAGLEDAALFEPWKHADALRRRAPNYPAAPVVDLAQSRAQALAAYSALRG